MERILELELKELRKLILSMGQLVEESIDTIQEAIRSKDSNLFLEIFEREKKINYFHKAVDNECLVLLAKQAPVATDLRFVLAIIKINTDLERMGDQCVNLAHSGKEYLGRLPVQTNIKLDEVATYVGEMVRESLDSFVKMDVELAKKVLESDDKIDNARNQIFSEMKTYMQSHSQEIDSCLDLILMARNLERLADHATNIAEEAIFLSTGKDIRHKN